MNDSTPLAPERPGRFHFGWVFPVLLRPRSAFAEIMASGKAVWLTPLLLLTVTGLLAVAAAGPIKQAAAQSGEVRLPPDFQWYTPEQQAQYLQAQAATSGPVFVYVFPAILTVLKVWVGWMVTAGLLHLVLTLLGGRGSTVGALNIVAWASLPFAVRDLVRAGAMFATGQLVENPGLTGFAPQAQGWVNAALYEVLARVDIYGLWFVLLMYIGARAGGGLGRRPAAAGVLITLALTLVLQVLPGVLGSQLAGLTIVRPFLF